METGVLGYLKILYSEFEVTLAYLRPSHKSKQTRSVFDSTPHVESGRGESELVLDGGYCLLAAEVSEPEGGYPKPQLSDSQIPMPTASHPPEQPLMAN